MGFVGIADGVGQTGVRYTCYEIHLRQRAVFRFLPGHDLAVAIAHDLYVDPLIIGVRVAVIGPQEGTDLHFIPGGGKLLHAVRGDPDNFTGTKFIIVGIPQLMIGKGFKGDTAAVFVSSHQHGEPAHLVPGGNDAVPEKQQHGAGAVNCFLGIADAVHQIVRPVDQSGSQLGGVDLAGGHGHELIAWAGEGFLHQFLSVVDNAHRGDGEHPQVRADKERLRIGVGNGADTGVAAEL